MAVKRTSIKFNSLYKELLYIGEIEAASDGVRGTLLGLFCHAEYFVEFRIMLRNYAINMLKAVT